MVVQLLCGCGLLDKLHSKTSSWQVLIRASTFILMKIQVRTWCKFWNQQKISIRWHIFSYDNWQGWVFYSKEDFITVIRNIQKIYLKFWCICFKISRKWLRFWKNIWYYDININNLRPVSWFNFFIVEVDKSFCLLSDNLVEHFPILESAMASISAGPVAPGDQVGKTNVTLLMRLVKQRYYQKVWNDVYWKQVITKR